jgi:hypothetical protein
LSYPPYWARWTGYTDPEDDHDEGDENPDEESDTCSADNGDDDDREGDGTRSSGGGGSGGGPTIPLVPAPDPADNVVECCGTDSLRTTKSCGTQPSRSASTIWQPRVAQSSWRASTL